MKTVSPDEFLQGLGCDACSADLETACCIDGDFRTSLGELLHIAMLCDKDGATVLTSETLRLLL